MFVQVLLRRAIRVLVLGLAAGLVAFAQTPRVEFSVVTSTDLTVPDPAGAVLGDFNQDGHLDLLVTSSNVQLFTGDGSGSLALAGGVFFAQGTAAAAADFNGDGYLDVVVTQDLASKQSFYGDMCGSTIGIGLFLGPNLSSGRCIATMQRVIAVQTADFNADGRPDIAVVSANSSGLWIYTGHFFDSPYTVQITPVPGGGLRASSMAPPVDLNGDGKLDIVVGHSGGAKTFLGNGDGTFTAGGSATSNATSAIAVGFLNDDARPDIAWVESGINGRVLVAFGAADNGLSPRVIATVASPNPGLRDVSIADVDHDGRQDIVVVDKGGGTIRIYYGNGDGTFVADPPLALTVKPKLVTVADWDEDGDTDLAILDSGMNGLSGLAWMALQIGSGPADATPPVVALASPADGRTVSGRIAVTAAASDNVGVTHVDFYADGRLIAKSAGPTYLVSWDTTDWPNGPVSVVAWAYDAAANVTQSSVVALTIANEPVADVTPPIVTVPPNAIIEATSPAGAAFTYSASATDHVDGTITPTCDPPAGATFPVGATTVTCTATDAHGNSSTASFTVTVVDTTGPIVTVPANATVEATSAAGAVYTFTASATDTLDGAVAVSCTPASGSTFPFGATTVSCTATDAHGNHSAASFTVTVTDTTGPVVMVPANATVEATSAAGATFTYSASATDLLDGSVATTCVPASGSTFPFGATTVTCTATDAHGNHGAASFTVTVTDTTGPVVTVPGHATVEATSAAGAVFTFTASATDALDGAVATTCTPASGSTFPVGATTVTCSATDVHGNSTAASFTVTVTDTTSPIVTVPAHATVEATSATGATFSYTASATDLLDGSVATTCTPTSGSTFPFGATTVTCTATDAHGNHSAASFMVTVTDTTGPIVTVPANATVEATSATGATFSYTASATDLFDGSVAVSCTPASGSTFPFGATTVTCAATDAHGNTSAASFTVTVTDTTGPVVTVPANATVEATSATGAVFTFTTSATDALDGAVATTCTPASGSMFPSGPTTVTCSASDAHGNSGSASFTVTVTDTTGPVVTMPAHATVEATSATGATFSYTASATDLFDGSVAVSCTPASGSTFPFGATTVTCAATDAHGNTSAASFTVTVTDTTGPVVMVPANATVEATSAAGAVFTFTASATDALDGALATTCTPASGSMFPSGPTTVACSASDAHGNMGSASFAVTVLAPVDQAPVAFSASYSLKSNTVLRGFLKATDSDGDALTFELITNAAKGNVVIDPVTGAFTYTSNRRGAEGRDQITFRVTDGTLASNPATITIKMSGGR